MKLLEDKVNRFLIRYNIVGLSAIITSAGLNLDEPLIGIVLGISLGILIQVAIHKLKNRRNETNGKRMVERPS